MSTTALDPRGRERTAVTVGRSFAWRMTGQIANALVNVAGMALLGNYLHAQGYGDYAFYYALVPLVASLTDLGAGAIITREAARDGEQTTRLFGDALLIKSAVGLPLFLAVLIASRAWLDPAHALLVGLVVAAALTDFSQDVPVWLFRAGDRQDLESLLLIAGQLLWVAGVAACAIFKAPLALALAASTAAFALRYTVGLILVWRRVGAPRIAPDFARLRALAAQGLPFGLAMFAVVLYGRVGVLLLKSLSTSAEVAYFNIGYMLSQPLGFVSSALTIAAFPTLSRFAIRDREALGGALRQCARYQFLAGLPISVGLYLLAGRVIPLLFHDAAFRSAATTLRLMSLGLVPIFLNLMSRYALVALNEQRIYLQGIGVGLAVNLVLTGLLAHRLGAPAACAGLIGGELAVLGICWRRISAHVSVADLLVLARKPLVAAGLMAVALVALRSWNVLLLMVTGAAIYAAALLLLGTFSSHDLDAARDLFHSFRGAGARRLAGDSEGS